MFDSELFSTFVEKNGENILGGRLRGNAENLHIRFKRRFTEKNE